MAVAITSESNFAEQIKESRKKIRDSFQEGHMKLYK